MKFFLVTLFLLLGSCSNRPISLFKDLSKDIHKTKDGWKKFKKDSKNLFRASNKFKPRIFVKIKYQGPELSHRLKWFVKENLNREFELINKKEILNNHRRWKQTHFYNHYGDTPRFYLKGLSHGSCGVFFAAITYFRYLERVNLKTFDEFGSKSKMKILFSFTKKIIEQMEKESR